MSRDRIDITPDTKVAELLKSYPELEGIILQFSPAFAALKNPVLRNTVAKVTSLRQAAKVGNVKVVARRMYGTDLSFSSGSIDQPTAK